MKHRSPSPRAGRLFGVGLLALSLASTLAAQEPPSNEELARRVDALSRELEDLRLGQSGTARADQVQHGMGPAASKIYRTEEGVSLGGYGEMVYSNFSSTDDRGAPSNATDEIDFLRGVFYFGYRFDENWIFNSELEFEHASTSASGSTSIEFAWVEYKMSTALRARTGMLLVPMGFINELHEPTTFLSASRPLTERVIIPSTWGENGLGIWGEVGPAEEFSYRLYLVNSFDASGFSASGLRGGRQKGSQAAAEDFALTGRLDWQGLDGLLLGGGFYAGDSGQGMTGAGGPIGAGTAIYELHAQYNLGGLQLRGLYTMATVDDVAALNANLGLVGNASVGEEMSGWYLEAGYDVLAHLENTEASLMPFVRIEQVNTQEKVPQGFSADPANDQEILTLGLTWQPFPQGILKFDWQNYDNAAGTGVDRFHLAIGYVF